MAGGRPRKYSKLVEFAHKINEYFKYCDGYEKPYTVSGLCIYLDITKETLLNYENKKEFFSTIKKAKLKIENWVEENSLMGKVNPTAAIFNLKNNFGWKDKQEPQTDTATIELIARTLSEVKRQADEINKQASGIHTEGDA